MSEARALSENRRRVTPADRGELTPPDVPMPASKRSLVAVSHAIESAVLQGPRNEPTVVVALFQRLAYFDREYAVYERLVAAGVCVVIAFVDGEQHHVPAGAHVVLLDAHEPLADEWSVVAVGPAAGAFLVATDTGEIDPTEQNLEAGRWFRGRWGYSRVQAANELARLRIAVGDRLDPGTARTVDDLLRRVMSPGGSAAGSRGTTGEQWAGASLQRMTVRMQDARAGSRRLRAQLADAHAAAEARAGARTEPGSGLPTPDYLARWAGSGGRAAALPIGLAVFDLPALDEAVERFGQRRAFHAARQVAAALSEPLGPVDAAVRLSAREFALVVPGASPRHLQLVAAAAAEQLELFSEGYPHVRLSARVATTVSLARPLPLDDLHLALGLPSRSEREPTTLSGDPIELTDSGTLADLAEQQRDGIEPRGGHATDRMPQVRVPGRPTTEAVLGNRHGDPGLELSRLIGDRQRS